MNTESHPNCSGFRPWQYAKAGPFTRTNFGELLPDDNRLSPEWVKSLTARGEREVYRGADLAKIGMSPVTFSVQARHNLFLAVKEAFNNLVRHAQATEVWLRIRFEDGALVVVVEDNGRGFELAMGRPGGNGLQNMRARVEHLGGGVDITSAPQQGTRIRFTLPPDAGRKTMAGADSRRD